MPLKSEWKKNLLLVLGSVALVCAACLAGDRLLGRWAAGRCARSCAARWS